MTMQHDHDDYPAPCATGSVGGRSQSEVERNLRHEGFDGQFGAREQGQILCFTCHREFAAAKVDADDARRVEGESDPADMAILVTVRCPHCDTAGIMALQFGTMASAEESEVVAAMHRVPSS